MSNILSIAQFRILIIRYYSQYGACLRPDEIGIYTDFRGKLIGIIQKCDPFPEVEIGINCTLIRLTEEVAKSALDNTLLQYVCDSEPPVMEVL